MHYYKDLLVVIYEMTVPSLPGAIFQPVLLKTDKKQIFNNEIFIDNKTNLSRENHSLCSRHQLSF